MKAEELQRQRILLMEGKITKSSKVFKDHPVFATNKPTNNFVARRRAKVKLSCQYLQQNNHAIYH